MQKSPLDEKLNEPIGEHSRRDFTLLRADQTIAQALASIRQAAPEGRIIYFYVVDADGRLVGVVPTRRLLLNPMEQLVAEIMVRNVVSIPHTATVLEACEFFTMHRLLAFPIVDEERHVMGIVDVDLYTEGLGDVERSERSDDLFQLIGVHMAEAQLASPWQSFRSRFPWLLCNIGGGLLAALLAKLFEADLQRVVAIALFIPVVLALAESVSIQSVSLALQLLHGKPPTLGSLLTKLRREFLTGSLLGIACGGAVGLVALIWLGEVRFASCLAVGIAGGVACSAVIGVTMPNVLGLLARDPRVAAGPIALAAADMLTLVLYFNLARWLL